MICFQIYFLRYLQQLGKIKGGAVFSCDLLSDLFFTIFATAKGKYSAKRHGLWFAFRFIFYDICNSILQICYRSRRVVICFQIYFLRYLQQHIAVKVRIIIRCDLLSDLFFTIFATAQVFALGSASRLWFAFRFIFYDICNSSLGYGSLPLSVVICFQIYFLRYLQQQYSCYSHRRDCCDLLSDLFFTIFATAIPYLHT